MTNPRPYFFLYLSVLLLLAPINLLSFDTYYYWEWSRHLALSYYDGSPMIAYFIKLSTLLFGDTLFALSFVGIAVTTLTAGIIYKTARLFLEKNASYVATALWVFSPLVTLDLLKQTTYDTPLTLFWALALFYIAKYLKSSQSGDLYRVGLSIGLMMLSKYSGIVFVLSLFIFLITTKYRALFKSPTIYLAMLLATILFTPVIVWNYQHEWQSFLYQLHTHVANNPINPLVRPLKALCLIFLPALNVMLILPFLHYKQKDDSAFFVHLCKIICITFLSFYLITASKATIRVYWLTPYLLTSALLGGFWFQSSASRQYARWLIGVYVFVSLGILINSTYKFNVIPDKKLIRYQLMQEFNQNYPQLPKTIITSGWFEARMLYFLAHKPTVYTVDCGLPQNQYGLWSEQIQYQLEHKLINEALYIDEYDRLACIEKYFDSCKKLPTPTYLAKHKTYSLNAYYCTSKQEGNT